MWMIQFRHVNKTYPSGVCALRNVSFHLPPGERVVLYGPSGSGKTTIVSLIAGLEKPTVGVVEVQASKVSVVFQEDRLFSHLSVFDNIAFGLDHHAFAEEEIERRVKRIAALTRIESSLAQKASALSGGQRQRVAIARALVSGPDVLLLDEAFNHLDPALKRSLIFDVLAWVDELNITLVSVCHDFQEAGLLGNHILVMQDGKLIQEGAPSQIRSHPVSLDVASSLSLLGVNVWKGQLVPVECCSFEVDEGAQAIHGWKPIRQFAYLDGFLHLGTWQGEPFYVYSKKEDAGENPIVYIHEEKKE